MNKTKLPVIIVGAGPVGLGLARALHLREIPAVVYEMLPELSSEARASTFHPPTLEMFAEWGILDEVLRRGHRVDRLQYWERESRQLIAELNYSALANDTPYPFRLQCPQSVLTRILRPYVEQSSYGDVLMEHQLTRFVDHGSCVEAFFDTPHGEKSVEGSFLCAADGAKSVVRKQLGFSFEGMTYEDRFLLAAVKMETAAHFPGIGPVSYFFDPEEWTIILQLPDITRIVFQMKNHEMIEQSIQPEAVGARIKQFLGTDNFTLMGVSYYSVHQRVSETFRTGRALLLGDAAHINNPMGGMGMNSGLHDAHFLAPRLAAVWNGAEEHLLNEYAEVRRNYALDHVRQITHKNYQDMTEKEQQARLHRNGELREIVADPQKQRMHLLRISMMEDRIPLSIG